MIRFVELSLDTIELSLLLGLVFKKECYLLLESNILTNKTLIYTN